MSQPKVYEFAKEIGMETIALMDKIREWDLPIKSHMAALSEDLIDEIRKRLSHTGGAGSQKSEKKVTKKTIAKKKAASQKVTKKVAKKITKKVVSKPAEVDAKKVIAKTVIRRKAGAGESPVEEPRVVAAAAALPRVPEIEPQGAQTETSVTTSVPEVQAPLVESIEIQEAQNVAKASTAAAKEASDKPMVRRPKNIVGRMDLRRVSQPGSSGGARSAPGSTSVSSGSPSNPRPVASARNIRPGFVGPAPMEAEPNIESRFFKEKKEPLGPKKAKAAGTGKELPVQNFTATEFRKREVIFQPKKKKIQTGQSKKTQITKPKASKRVVEIHDSITVADLAQQMNLKLPQLTKVLMKEGVKATPSTTLDFETVSLIVGEFDWEAKNVHLSVDDLIVKARFGNFDAEPVGRPPVVTVMGHVDHGKTTLLDSIRKTNVTKGEAGGITQHIGAYSVKLDDGNVTTFIDTPGHAAFTAMRARGANVTDIVVVVVAADDGLMPQTEEAINHAKAANVPIIVAINKMDKPDANPDRIKQQLTEFELVPEEWGGSTIFCEVSALKGDGVTNLLEQIHLVAEVAELSANPNRSATGLVIESRMEKGRGPVATLLVKQGTLNVGDAIVVGAVSGRVRSMMDDKGRQVKAVTPGYAVEIMGLGGVPEAGDQFDVTETEEQARGIAELREQQRKVESEPSAKLTMEEILAKVKAGSVKELSIVLKADVAGSLEAIKGMFAKVGNEEVKPKVIHDAVGAISESDVLLASTAGGLVIGFNVRPDTAASRLAKEKGIEIKSYSIIYELVDDIKALLSGMLDPDIVEKGMGRAEVRDIFSVPKVGVIAGCFVVDGKIGRNHMARLLRDGRVIYEGNISSLKRFKDDAREVASGYECGIGIENFNDLKVGDEIESFIKEEVAREL